MSDNKLIEAEERNTIPSQFEEYGKAVHKLVSVTPSHFVYGELRAKLTPSMEARGHMTAPLMGTFGNTHNFQAWSGQMNGHAKLVQTWRGVGKFDLFANTNQKWLVGSHIKLNELFGLNKNEGSIDFKGGILSGTLQPVGRMSFSGGVPYLTTKLDIESAGFSYEAATARASATIGTPEASVGLSVMAQPTSDVILTGRSIGAQFKPNDQAILSATFRQEYQKPTTTTVGAWKSLPVHNLSSYKVETGVEFTRKSAYDMYNNRLQNGAQHAEHNLALGVRLAPKDAGYKTKPLVDLRVATDGNVSTSFRTSDGPSYFHMTGAGNWRTQKTGVGIGFCIGEF